MTFVRFTETGKSFKPKASIWSRGQIGFNQGAVNRLQLDKFNFAILFYDEETRKVGFLFTNDENENGAIKIVNKKTGAVISGKSFLDFFEIKHEKTKNYTLEKEGDYYVIDLNEPENK